MQPQKTKFVQDFQGVKVDTTRTVFNVTPTFEYRYNPNDLTRLEITYRGNTSQPSMSDLLDITDDSYPMRITKGNPGLKPSFSNNLRLNYNTYIREQLAHSKIGVVYYNYAGDWAVPFARQIWKDTGGNSSHTPLLVAGNSEHADPDEQKVFNGIMDCTIDEQLRIPLDIKVFLDKNNKQQ